MAETFARIGTPNFVLLILSILVCFETEVNAEVYRYTDASGKVNYVDSTDKVPAQYRDQLVDAKPLPRITKVESFYSKAVPGYKSASSSQKVQLFVTSWCPYCKKMEDFLRQKRINFTRLDIERDSSAKKMFQSLNLSGGGVPVTKVGNTIIRGYQPDQVAQTLNIR